MIPEEELHAKKGVNLAPMVDFLFLILAAFAILTVSRTALYDSEVSLVKIPNNTPSLLQDSEQQGSTILLSISQQGQYKWVTEFNEFLLENVGAVQKEILRQQHLGQLPQDRSQTKVLLHIDKGANWESVAPLIFVIKDAGYQVSPVYCPEG